MSSRPHEQEPQMYIILHAKVPQVMLVMPGDAWSNISFEAHPPLIPSTRSKLYFAGLVQQNSKARFVYPTRVHYSIERA